jgi:hypothetical protein
MNALVIPFPRRGLNAVRIERIDGDWLLLFRSQGWPFSSREAALQEAVELADQINADIIVKPTPPGGSPC